MQRLDQSILNSNTSAQVNKQIKIIHKCIKGNTLSLFCTNKKCQQKYKFICNDEDCQCYQNHQNCINKANIKPILKKISQKINKNKQQLAQFKKQITQIFTKLINKISQDEQKILKDVEELCNLVHLIDQQKKFYETFIDQKQQYLKQFDILKLCKILQNTDLNQQNKQKDQQLLQKCNQKIQIFEKMCQQTIQINIKHYEKTINLLRQKIMRHKKQQQNYLTLTLDNLSASSIITTENHFNNLINFFDKKVKGANLLFKASANDFDMIKYYQKCGNLANTIILCQTNKNKIVGGYTPLTFNPIKNEDEFVCDQSGKSFLFSLTNNHKFQLKQKNKTILRYINKQRIGFGYNCTLGIANKANADKSNYFNLKYKIYVNQNYNDDINSYQKLIGTQNKWFSVKQWQVLQVLFQ